MPHITCKFCWRILNQNQLKISNLRDKHFKRKALLWTHLYHKQINARQTNNTKGFFYRKFLRKIYFENISLYDNWTFVNGKLSRQWHIHWFWEFFFCEILNGFCYNMKLLVTLWFVWSELWWRNHRRDTTVIAVSIDFQIQ